LNSGTKPKLGLALCFVSFVHSAGSFSPWFLLPPVFFVRLCPPSDQVAFCPAFIRPEVDRRCNGRQ
jgi:hypothetical protein